MVQFNLPKNSKILKGKYFKDSSGSKNLKKVVVDGTVVIGESEPLMVYEKTPKRRSG